MLIASELSGSYGFNEVVCRAIWLPQGSFLLHDAVFCNCILANAIFLVYTIVAMVKYLIGYAPFSTGRAENMAKSKDENKCMVMKYINKYSLTLQKESSKSMYYGARWEPHNNSFCNSFLTWYTGFFTIYLYLETV